MYLAGTVASRNLKGGWRPQNQTEEVHAEDRLPDPGALPGPPEFVALAAQLIPGSAQCWVGSSSGRIW